MDTDHEALEIIRRRLEHEDNLVNQRLSWILMSQAFLLTGYAILGSSGRMQQLRRRWNRSLLDQHGRSKRIVIAVK